MNKSDLIELISDSLSETEMSIPAQDLETAVNCILLKMSTDLGKGSRIEIRGFGSFSLNYRPPRVSRNPKTGETVDSFAIFVPHFKPSKLLRSRVNDAFLLELSASS